MSAGHALGREATALLHDKLGRTADRVTMQWGVVAAKDSATGLLSVRPLTSDTANDELWAHVSGVAPAVGDEVVYALFGSSWIVLGVIRRTTTGILTLDAPTVGQAYADGAAQSAPDSANNTTTAYVVAMALTSTVPPAGVYDIVAHASCLLACSTAAGVGLIARVAGTAGTERTANPPNDAQGATRVVTTQRFPGVFVSGAGLTVTCEYRNLSAGTTTVARNPDVSYTATRVA